MKDVLKSTKIPLNTRKRILQCYVWSTVLYGAETWTITKVMKTHIEAFELWDYRKVLKISWTEKVTNNKVLSRMKMKKHLFTIIQMKKLKYFGNINRHSSMQTTPLNGRVHGKRGRRKPRTSWTSNIKEWTGKSYIKAVRLTVTDMSGGSLHSTVFKRMRPDDDVDDDDDGDEDDDWDRSGVARIE